MRRSRPALGVFQELEPSRGVALRRSRWLEVGAFRVKTIVTLLVENGEMPEEQEVVSVAL